MQVKFRVSDWRMEHFWMHLAGGMLLMNLALLLVAAVIGQGRDRQVIAYVSARQSARLHVFLMDIQAGLSAKANDVWATSSCCLSWSPDGRQLAVAGWEEHDGQFKIYVMDADGKNTHPLVKQIDWSNQANPSWSPDGAYIAFTADQGDNRLSLLLADVRTGDVRRLGAGSVGNFPATWLPNAEKLIVAVSFSDLAYQIMSVKPTGTDLYPIYAQSWDSASPEVSSDGSRILFTSNQSSGNELYTMNIDGTDAKPLTDGYSSEFNPRWSPDGRHISFSASRNSASQIFTMNADGTGERPLTSAAFNAYNPIWSPNGSQILFSSYREGLTNFYVINTDGTGERRLTNDSAVTYAAWQP